jgi:hypothetical protein
VLQHPSFADIADAPRHPRLRPDAEVKTLAMSGGRAGGARSRERGTPPGQ